QEGRIKFPNQTIIYEPWYDDLIDELLKFPKATHDDQVDALVQALLWCRLNPSITGVSKVYYNYSGQEKPKIEIDYQKKIKEREVKIDGFVRLSRSDLRSIF
ncbi:MAG: hypothetical protein ACK4NC_07185, partial [Candidatus Gracilibacteria bacterium]